MLADGKVVGGIFVSQAAPQDRQWMWTIAYGHHADRTPTRGYEPTREAAMAAFAKSWRRQSAPPCSRRGSIASGGWPV
jgi:hypothetical protein